MRTVYFAAAAIGALSLASVARADESRCRALAGLPLAGVHDATLTRPEAKDPAQAVDHCILRGALNPRTGADGHHYEIRFELRLPKDWNGRFLFQGGGGLNGSVRPAIGSAGRSAPSALARGFAVVSTDTGHEGDGAAFAADPIAWKDFAYAAIPQVNVVARKLVTAYYDRPLTYSYFLGCSNGGREAMMATQRLASQFDGVVAGAPAFNMTQSQLEQAWENALLVQAAPKDANGAPLIALALTDADLKLVVGSALEQCDSADGLADGMIFSTGCKVDLQRLDCGKAPQGSCLTAEKIALVDRLFAGVKSKTGKALYAPWMVDAGVVSPSWRRQKLGTATSGEPNSSNATRGREAFYQFMLRRPVPKPLATADEVMGLVGALKKAGRVINADDTDLVPFAAKGGKLILYHGNSDATFSSLDTVRWYEAARARTDASVKTDWAALFLIPGMGHCGGGPAVDDFDMLTPITQWVEHQQYPAQVLARSASLKVERPLCPYPAVTTYQGSGDPAASASFRCAVPAAPTPSSARQS